MKLSTKGKLKTSSPQNNAYWKEIPADMKMTSGTQKIRNIGSLKRILKEVF